MHSLTDKLTNVAGIGPLVATKLATKNLLTIQDFLLWVPLRYEDRSTQKLIKDLVINELVTIKAEVTVVSSQSRGGRRSIQRATICDHSASLRLIWFNSPYIKDTLQKGKAYFFSGKLNNRGMMTQPKVEKISPETLHTNRLVPIYSTIADLKQGNLRRYLKKIIEQLQPLPDPLTKFDLLSLSKALQHLHFPDNQALTIKARERLAIEELLGLMQHSRQIKKQWQTDASAPLIKINQKNQLPTNLPFTLTTAQKRSSKEILADLQTPTPMNRLLLGDVGSGKTVVAGIAIMHTLKNQHHVAFIAPTQILAKQHQQTFRQLFPQLKIQLLTAKSKFILHDQPTLYLGTHAVINKLQEIKPALVVYDEQHRFGVKQRSETTQLAFKPHALTMSATPIPRSLMLTIFAHLELSVLDELPQGRQAVKTWLVPEKKRSSSYAWIKEQLQFSGKTKQQVLIICPFIDPSEAAAFVNVKSATEVFAEIQQQFPTYTVELLHGRLKPKEKDRLTRALFAQKIDILVTTPIVEVGIDLPAASIMIIESAERFGLASLHQLRGRVGRAGQQAYCLLFPSSNSPEIKKRLQIFTQTNDGMKLAEFDLKNRGAGDLFGTEQHGFGQLKFASWANVKLITQAKKIFDQIKNQHWESLFNFNRINHTPSTN